jgi:hypothetical protein
VRRLAGRVAQLLGLPRSEIRIVNSGPGLWVIGSAAPWPADFNVEDPPEVQVFRAASSAGGRTVEPGQTVTVVGNRVTFEMRQDFGLWAQWQVTERLVDSAKKRFDTFVEKRPVLNALVTCGRFGWGAGKQIAELPDQDPAEVLDGFTTNVAQGGECAGAVRTADNAVHRPAPTGPLANATSMAERAASEAPLVRQAESAWGRALRTGVQWLGRLV